MKSRRSSGCTASGKQFRRYFEAADRRKGNTGANLLSLLECRLDNVVYRMGFGSTRRSSSVCFHKAMTVNGQSVNIPSYLVKAGDVIAVRENPRSKAVLRKRLNWRSKSVCLPG